MNAPKELDITDEELETFVFILSDIPTNIKKYEFDSWYKTSINNTSGIWLGNGVTDQNVIKANIPFRNNLKEIGVDNAVIVKNSKPYLVKIIKKGVEFV